MLLACARAVQSCSERVFSVHAPHVAAPLVPFRSTRGKRMNQALEDEDDEQFWNQDFFKARTPQCFVVRGAARRLIVFSPRVQEEENDASYATESEEADTVDSDFWNSEDDKDDAEGGGADEEDDRPR